MHVEQEANSKARRSKGIRRALAAEFIGTALLVFLGLSIVIVDFGKGGAVASFLPDPGARRALTGFLFGTTGALIAVSWVGKASGAHINPAVTLGFWILKKMGGARAIGYVLMQMMGAVVGALPLLIWGKLGRSVDFGATVPGAGFSVWSALSGEILTTLALIIGLFLFIGHKRLAAWTPLLFPFLYAIMVYLEAPISGTSTNPARSFGPAVVSGVWNGWWVYLAGPVVGALLGALAQKVSFLQKFEIEVAKVYHFSHDPHGIFHYID